MALVVIGTGCSKKFDEYATNPNLPQSVPAYLLLRSVENAMPVFPGGDADKFCQFTLSSYTYYGNNEYWTGAAGLNYGNLRDVIAMETEAAKASGTTNNPYSALAKFFKAYFFINMTLKVGDLPMSEAMKGLDNTTPKYDTQKETLLHETLHAISDEMNLDLSEEQVSGAARGILAMLIDNPSFAKFLLKKEKNASID